MFFLSLQVCKDAGNGIASMDSAEFRDVSTSNWTFAMYYTNEGQGTTVQVSYTLAAGGGTHFALTAEDTEYYVSCRPFFSVQLIKCMPAVHVMIVPSAWMAGTFDVSVTYNPRSSLTQ